MKVIWAILFAMLLCLSVKADVETAQSFDDVTRFLELNQDDTVALLFTDSTLTNQTGTGFLSGVVSSVTHIFSGVEEADASNQRVAEIEKEISNETSLLQIDVSNENLKEIQESYDVTTVPFLIVFKRGIVVLKEVPTHETHDKILQVLNVNPAAVHEESATVEEKDTQESVPESSKVEVVKPAAEAKEETIVEPVSVVEENVVEETVVEPVSVVEETPTKVEKESEVIILDEEIPNEVVIEEPTKVKGKVDISEPEKTYTKDIDIDNESAVPRSFELGPRPIRAQPKIKPVVKPVVKPIVKPVVKPVTVKQQVTSAPGEEEDKSTANKK